MGATPSQAAKFSSVAFRVVPWLEANGHGVTRKATEKQIPASNTVSRTDSAAALCALELLLRGLPRHSVAPVSAGARIQASTRPSAASCVTYITTRSGAPDRIPASCCPPTAPRTHDAVVLAERPMSDFRPGGSQCRSRSASLASSSWRRRAATSSFQALRNSARCPP